MPETEIERTPGYFDAIEDLDASSDDADDEQYEDALEADGEDLQDEDRVPFAGGESTSFTSRPSSSQPPSAGTDNGPGVLPGSVCAYNGGVAMALSKHLVVPGILKNVALDTVAQMVRAEMQEGNHLGDHVLSLFDTVFKGLHKNGAADGSGQGDPLMSRGFQPAVHNKHLTTAAKYLQQDTFRQTGVLSMLACNESVIY
jgi:hypothetical protein